MVLVELIKKQAQKMDIHVNFFLQTLSKTVAFAYYDKRLIVVDQTITHRIINKNWCEIILWFYINLLPVPSVVPLWFCSLLSLQQQRQQLIWIFLSYKP